MTISSIGYDGSVAEGPWAKLAPTLGTRYWVADEDAWRVTAKSAASWTVIAAAGVGGGDGVYDDSSDSVELFLPSPTGTQWYVIYAQRDWSGDGGTTTFEYEAALSTGDLPSSLIDEQDPGNLTKQPIALVQIIEGQSQPTDIIDLRVWQSNGGAVAVSDKVRQYLVEPGTQLLISGVNWVREVTLANALVWKSYRMQPVIAQRRWSAGRNRPGIGYDNYSTETWAPLCTVNLGADAPAGEYSVRWTWVGVATGGGPMAHDILITGPAGAGRMIPAHLIGSQLTQTFSSSVPFTHLGGSATFRMSAKASSAGRIASVFNDWTLIDVHYEGPVG